MKNIENKVISPILINSDINSLTEIMPNVYLDVFTENDRESFFGWVVDWEAKKNQTHEIMKNGNGEVRVILHGDKPIAKQVNENPYYSVKPVSNIIDYRHKLILSQNNISKVQSAFRLLKTCNFGIKYSYLEQLSARLQSMNDYSNSSFPTLEFNNEDIKPFKKIFNQIEQLESDPTLKLILGKLDYVLSCSSQNNTKFLDLMTILEILYLPDGNSELTFRISLRVTKMLKKFHSETVAIQIFDQMTKLYKIRSQIVHSGKPKKEKEMQTSLVDLLDIVRKSILIYINDPNCFKDAQLTNLCLE